MKAIKVKYHAVTETRPGRYVADDGDGNRVALSIHDATPEITAAALCLNMKWHGTLIRGTYRSEYIFTFVPPSALKTKTLSLSGPMFTVPDCTHTQGQPPGEPHEIAVRAWFAMRRSSKSKKSVK